MDKCPSHGVPSFCLLSCLHQQGQQSLPHSHPWGQSWRSVMGTWSWSHLCEEQGGHQPFGINYEGEGGNCSQSDIPDLSSPNDSLGSTTGTPSPGWWDEVSILSHFQSSSFVTSALSPSLKTFPVFLGATSALSAQPTIIRQSSGKKSPRQETCQHCTEAQMSLTPTPFKS